MTTLEPYPSSFLGTEDSMEVSNEPNSLDTGEDIDIELDPAEAQATEYANDEDLEDYEDYFIPMNADETDAPNFDDDPMLDDYASNLQDADEEVNEEIQDPEDHALLEVDADERYTGQSNDNAFKEDPDQIEPADSSPQLVQKSPQVPAVKIDDGLRTPQRDVIDSQIYHEAEFFISPLKANPFESARGPAPQEMPIPEIQGPSNVVELHASEGYGEDEPNDHKVRDSWQEADGDKDDYGREEAEAGNVNMAVETKDGGRKSNGTTLHPVVIEYLDATMSLFPPLADDDSNPSTFLLQDESLAYGSISNLLHALREILEDGVGDIYEVEMAINELDLRFCQSSGGLPAATLAEIVEMYVSLYNNDGALDTPPLHAHLYTVTNPSKRWEQLKSLIEEGKGLSHIRTAEDYENEITEGSLEAPEENTDQLDATTSNTTQPNFQPKHEDSERADVDQDLEPTKDGPYQLDEKDDLEDPESYLTDPDEEQNLVESKENSAKDTAKDSLHTVQEGNASGTSSPKSSTDTSTLRGDNEASHKSQRAQSVDEGASVGNDAENVSIDGQQGVHFPEETDEIEEEDLLLDETEEYGDNTKESFHQEATTLEADPNNVDYSADHDDTVSITNEGEDLSADTKEGLIRINKQAEERPSDQAGETLHNVVDPSGDQGEVFEDEAQLDEDFSQAEADHDDTIPNEFDHQNPNLSNPDGAVFEEGATLEDAKLGQHITSEPGEDGAGDQILDTIDTGDQFFGEIEDDSYFQDTFDPDEFTSAPLDASPGSLKRRRSIHDDDDLEDPIDQGRLQTSSCKLEEGLSDDRIFPTFRPISDLRRTESGNPKSRITLPPLMPTAMGSLLPATEQQPAQ